MAPIPVLIPGVDVDAMGLQVHVCKLVGNYAPCHPHVATKRWIQLNWRDPWDAVPKLDVAGYAVGLPCE